MIICFFAKKVDQMAFALAICNGLYNWDMRLFVLLISISMGDIFNEWGKNTWLAPL